MSTPVVWAQRFALAFAPSSLLAENSIYPNEFTPRLYAKCGTGFSFKALSFVQKSYLITS